MHALKLLGRPTAKIHSINAPIDKEAVKRWISRDKKEDLITSHKLANGFESDFVIVMGSWEHSSRSSAFTANIDMNSILDYLPIVDSLSHDHHCLKYLSGEKIMPLKTPLEIVGRLLA